MNLTSKIAKPGAELQGPTQSSFVMIEGNGFNNVSLGANNSVAPANAFAPSGSNVKPTSHLTA